MKNIFVIILLLIISLFVYFFSNKENFETNKNIKYYVISLRSEDRLTNIKNQQQKMKSKIEIVDGVLGKNLTKNDIQSSNDPIIEFTNENIDNGSSDNNIKKNEIGCYLSHYNLYKKIASNNNLSQYSVIFEDDFYINNDFETELKNGLDKIQDFDIIYLYLTGYTKTEQKSQNICFINNDVNLYGSTGYVINNKNIQKIIDVTKVMKSQIDMQLQNAIYEKRLEAYKFCPYIVNIASLPSTIQMM